MPENRKSGLKPQKMTSPNQKIGVFLRWYDVYIVFRKPENR